MSVQVVAFIELPSTFRTSVYCGLFSTTATTTTKTTYGPYVMLQIVPSPKRCIAFTRIFRSLCMVLVAPLNMSADLPTVSNDCLRDVVALHTCRVPVHNDDIDDVSWCCTRLQLTDSGPQYIFIVRAVVSVVDDDVLLRRVPMVMATMSTIDGYGFSFNYVGRGEHH